MTVFPIIALLFPVYHDNPFAVINAFVELFSILFDCLSGTIALFSEILCSSLGYLGSGVCSAGEILCSFFDAITRLVIASANSYSAIYTRTGTIVTIVAFLCITFFVVKWSVATDSISTKNTKRCFFGIIAVIAIFHLAGSIASSIAHLA